MSHKKEQFSLVPHSDEAESAVLGAMILDSACIDDVAEIIVRPEDFYNPAHTALYDVIIRLHRDNIPIDMVMLNQKLRDQGKLEQIGGVEYLIALGDSVPSSSSAKYYAGVVREKALARDMYDLCIKLKNRIESQADQTSDTYEWLESNVYKLSETEQQKRETAPLPDLLRQLYDQLQMNRDKGEMVSGLDCGFYDLNHMLGGLQNKDLIIIAGRPSMGKTALAVNIAENVGSKSGLPVGIFSLEMSQKQVTQRLLSSVSKVDSQRITRNLLTEDDYYNLANAYEQIKDMPIYIDDTPRMTIDTLRAKARRMKAKYGVRLIVVDYLQLMDADKGENRQQEVSKISRGIKSIARELDVPVICLSQLNRGSESREDRRPRLSDLRESGAIEQDADVVLMLYREEYYHPDSAWRASNPDKLGVADVIIGKQRNGPTGVVNLLFNESTTRFDNLER
jgi:replicative DNA helicase